MYRKHPECGGASGRASSGPDPNATRNKSSKIKEILDTTSRVKVIDHFSKKIGKGKPGPGRGHKGPMIDSKMAIKAPITDQ